MNEWMKYQHLKTIFGTTNYYMSWNGIQNNNANKNYFNKINEPDEKVT